LNGDATIATIVPGSKGLYIEILSGMAYETCVIPYIVLSQLPTANCVASGDGNGIRMKNGSQKSQQVANAVTQYSNNQDQVMLALQHLQGLGGMLKLDDDQEC
jgi:hypothetical protein